MSDAAVSADSVVSLRPVTAQNVYAILDLKVSEGQERFVASNANSLAEAYVQPSVAWPRAIYADETPVGFLMLEDNPQEKSHFLWRLMIDSRYQGFGFGRQDHGTAPGARQDPAGGRRPADQLRPRRGRAGKVLPPAGLRADGRLCGRGDGDEEDDRRRTIDDGRRSSTVHRLLLDRERYLVRLAGVVAVPQDDHQPQPVLAGREGGGQQPL
jgi:hypothetical protein